MLCLLSLLYKDRGRLVSPVFVCALTNTFFDVTIDAMPLE